MKNIEVATMLASTMNKKDILGIRKIVKQKFNKACRSKHKFSSSIRRNTKKETEAGKHKSMLNILDLALDIQHSGFLLIEEDEELSNAVKYVEKMLSDYFNRPFKV